MLITTGGADDIVLPKYKETISEVLVSISLGEMVGVLISLMIAKLLQKIFTVCTLVHVSQLSPNSGTKISG